MNHNEMWALIYLGDGKLLRLDYLCDMELASTLLERDVLEIKLETISGAKFIEVTDMALPATATYPGSYNISSEGSISVDLKGFIVGGQCYDFIPCVDGVEKETDMKKLYRVTVWDPGEDDAEKGFVGETLVVGKTDEGAKTTAFLSAREKKMTEADYDDLDFFVEFLGVVRDVK